MVREPENPKQPEKAQSPIEVTESGIVKDPENPLQFKKALYAGIITVREVP